MPTPARSSILSHARIHNPTFHCTPYLVAHTPWQRLRGLMRLPSFTGILAIVPCHDVHTWGMSEPIDIAFVDMAGMVVASYTQVQPRSRRRCKKAAFTLERRSNDQYWPKTGDYLQIHFD